MIDKDLKELILSKIVWEEYPKRNKGGQQCGIPRIGYKLTHPDFSFEISICEFRSALKNRETCLLLFELFLDEKIK